MAESFQTPLRPEAAGLDAAALDRAVAFALAHPSSWPHDIRTHIEGGFFEPPPDNAILGPVAPRGAANGLVLRHGRLVAVVARYVAIDPGKVNINLDRGGDMSTLAIEIELPAPQPARGGRATAG
jgi:hypothetical protein